jgi:hypothetical protein
VSRVGLTVRRGKEDERRSDGEREMRVVAGESKDNSEEVGEREKTTGEKCKRGGARLRRDRKRERASPCINCRV